MQCVTHKHTAKPEVTHSKYTTFTVDVRPDWNSLQSLSLMCRLVYLWHAWLLYLIDIQVILRNAGIIRILLTHIMHYYSTGPDVGRHITVLVFTVYFTMQCIVFFILKISFYWAVLVL